MNTKACKADLLQEYMDKVDPSGIAVTYIAAEKGLKRAALAIGATPDSPDMSAARGLTGWSNTISTGN